jgi:hypothetical protein
MAGYPSDTMRMNLIPAARLPSAFGFGGWDERGAWIRGDS